MAASVSGSKTVTKAVAPHLPAATLTTLLATPVENLTFAQFKTLEDALNRVASGHEPNQTIGQVLL